MRDWLKDFVKLDFAVLNKTHRFFVILPVPLWALQRIVAEEKIVPSISECIFCDPSSKSFEALKFNLKFDTRSVFTSIHAKTSVMQATWKGFSIGIRTGIQGDPRQQGGAFVIAPVLPDGVAGHGVEDGDCLDSGYLCKWKHYDRHNSDQVEIPVLLRAADVPNLNAVCTFMV